MYRSFIFFFSLICSLFSQIDTNTCFKSNRDFGRQEYIYPEQISSENFVIHFTTNDSDYQDINGQLFSLESSFSYAQSIIDLAELSLQKYIDDGWEYPPPDCDESIQDNSSPLHCSNYGGNSLYDIYISNDGPGMVVPESSYPIEPYSGGYTSFMKISTLSNNYELIPSWSYHVVAHEVHHAVQLRYGSGTSGTPGNYTHNLWFFEQTASYMENVVFPDNIHLQTMLANCNVVTPLTYPEHGIDYPAELYQYRSALWQKFLVESLNDSAIVKNMWEEYGIQYASGNQVSLFPIYESVILESTNMEYSLTNAFKDYAIWRYFTGSYSVPNLSFNNANSYCSSTVYEDFSNPFIFRSNTGGAFFIELPSSEFGFILSSSNANDIQVFNLTLNNEQEFLTSNFSAQSNNFLLDLNTDEFSSIIVVSKYNGVNSEDISFIISENESILGDVNFDGTVNVIDVLYIVNFTIGINQPTDLELQASDVNIDNVLDILDVVILVNLILNEN